MFNDRIRLTANSAVDFLIKVLLGAAGIALLGGISIPLQDEVDLTLQTLMVLLPAVLFGWEVGLGAVVLYIVVGGIGVPVFPLLAPVDLTIVWVVMLLLQLVERQVLHVVPLYHPGILSVESSMVSGILLDVVQAAQVS